MSPKVSVVIPVFNAERYLEECLGSVAKQTLKEIEVICVDDGSTDGSLGILRAYEENDPRFQIVCTSHQGGGGARNKGLEVACGEYVAFLDSDDFFEPNLLELTYSRGIEFGADIVVFEGRRFDDRAGTLLDKPEFVRKDVLPQKDCFSRSDLPNFIFQLSNPAPWSKLFKREFLEREGIRFQVLQNTNDWYFSFLSLAVAHGITVVEEDLVRYRINTCSSTQDKKERNPICFLEAIYALHDELVGRGVYEEVELSFVRAALSTTRYCIRTVESDDALRTIGRALSDEKFESLNLLGRGPNGYMGPSGYDDALFVEAVIEGYEHGMKDCAMLNPVLVQTARSLQEGFPAVSVIVPVYNSESYLNDVMSSLVNQSLQNIEIIAIDDGSVDGSLDLLKRWGECDPRITIVKQQNGGLSAARNEGLRHARGAYVCFVDSDDRLKLNALKSLSEIAHRDDLDMLLFDAQPFYENDELRKAYSGYDDYYHRSCSHLGSQKGSSLMATLVAEGDYLPSACLYLVKTSFLKDNSLGFLPGVLHEDNAFTFTSMLRAERAAHVQDDLYLRRVRENSITTGSYSFERAYGLSRCALVMEKEYWRTYDSMSTDERMAAYGLVENLRGVAIEGCRCLPQRELFKRFLLGGEKRHFFEISVLRPAEMLDERLALKEKVSDLQKHIEELEGDLSAIVGSRSFRLGRALAFPLAALRRLGASEGNAG